VEPHHGHKLHSDSGEYDVYQRQGGRKRELEDGKDSLIREHNAIRDSDIEQDVRNGLRHPRHDAELSDHNFQVT
jgi:hypothetical protein